MQWITQDSMEMDPHDPDEARWASHYPVVGLWTAFSHRGKHLTRVTYLALERLHTSDLAKVEHAVGLVLLEPADPMASVN